jgi:hypothetical protein
MHARVKKLNPHANTPAAVKMNEINPKYENTRKIHRLGTAFLLEHRSLPQVFCGVRVEQSVVFCIELCRLLFVVWSVLFSHTRGKNEIVLTTSGTYQFSDVTE